MVMRCVVCGCFWGSGEVTESSGICPKCFMEWANGKKKSTGNRECYGEFEQHNDVDCSICTLSKLCFKDIYGIR